MFGIGFFELCIIAVVALVFVGPKRLPDLMKQVGKFFVQARRVSNEVRSTFDTVVRDAEDDIRRQEYPPVNPHPRLEEGEESATTEMPQTPQQSQARMSQPTASKPVSFTELSEPADGSKKPGDSNGKTEPS